MLVGYGRDMGDWYQTPRFVEGVSIDWDALGTRSYVQQIPAIRSIEHLAFDSAVTFFVGENGTGKSTLLEAIAVAYGFNAEGGTLNYRFSTVDDVSRLCDALTVERGRGKSQSSYFFRAESFFNVATKARDYAGGGYRSQVLAHLHERSHGEGFLDFFNSFDGAGLYIMDEPEGRTVPAAPARPTDPPARVGGPRRAVHYRHAFADPARPARCNDP